MNFEHLYKIIDQIQVKIMDFEARIDFFEKRIQSLQTNVDAFIEKANLVKRDQDEMKTIRSSIDKKISTAKDDLLNELLSDIRDVCRDVLSYDLAYQKHVNESVKECISTLQDDVSKLNERCPKLGLYQLKPVSIEYMKGDLPDE